MSKQSPERLEYLRNYRKNHKEQQRKYQKKYIDKLRQQGKYPISTSMKLRNEIQDLQQELQRKDNIINVIKEELSKDFNTYICKNKSYGKTFKAGAEVYKEHLLYKIKELENSRSDE